MNKRVRRANCYIPTTAQRLEGRSKRKKGTPLPVVDPPSSGRDQMISSSVERQRREDFDEDLMEERERTQPLRERLTKQLP